MYIHVCITLFFLLFSLFNRRPGGRNPGEGSPRDPVLSRGRSAAHRVHGGSQGGLRRQGPQRGRRRWGRRGRKGGWGGWGGDEARGLGVPFVRQQLLRQQDGVLSVGGAKVFRVLLFVSFFEVLLFWGVAFLLFCFFTLLFCFAFFVLLFLALLFLALLFRVLLFCFSFSRLFCLFC